MKHGAENITQRYLLASSARTNTHNAYSTKFIKLNSVNLYVYLKSRFWFLDAGEDRCATVTAVQIETCKLMLALPEFYLPLTQLLRVLLWQRNSQYIIITLYSRSPNTRTRLAEKQTSVKGSDEHLTRNPAWLIRSSRNVAKQRQQDLFNIQKPSLHYSS